MKLKLSRINLENNLRDSPKKPGAKDG